jgi:hypothetical protein
LAHDDPATDLRIDDVARTIGFAAPAGPAGAAKAASAGSAPEPAAEAERALASAICQVNGIDGLDTSDCYTVAGGRVLRIPRVLARLREDGWEGVSVNQLSGGAPLRVLAGRLGRVL